MSELKTCGDIIREIQVEVASPMSGLTQEEKIAKTLEMGRKAGLIACPGCRAKIKAMILKLGIVSEAVLDTAINSGIADPNRNEAIKDKMRAEIDRFRAREENRTEATQKPEPKNLKK